MRALFKLLIIALTITLVILFTSSYRLKEIKEQSVDRFIKNNNIIPIDSKTKDAQSRLNNRKYLLILDIFEDEQLTQFTQVIKQAITLARLSNRILVLPYVSDSHILGPRKLSEFNRINYPYYNFTFYYNIEQFKGNVITMYEYENMKEFDDPVIAFYADPNESSPYSTDYKCRDEENEYIESVLNSMFKSKENICYNVNDNDYLVVSSLLKKFNDDTVAFAHYHKGIMSEKDTNTFIPSIPFSNDIIEESIRYRKEIFDDCYIALHWRYEKTNISFIPIVLDAVYERFKEIKDENECNHIFFASEYSSNGSDSFSDEERSSKRNYYKRTKRLLQSIGYKITEGYHGDIKDAGVVAILDRLLCEQSTLFFPVDQSSSFTLSILNSRKGKSNDLTVFKPYFNPFEKKYYEHLKYPSKTSVSLFIHGDSSQIDESIKVLIDSINDNPLNVTIFYIDPKFNKTQSIKHPNIEYHLFGEYDEYDDNDKAIYDFIKVSF